MKKTVYLLLVLVAVASVGVVAGDELPSRRIHVADGGLVFITDTLAVTSEREVLRLGITAEFAKYLAGYYIADEVGIIRQRSTEDIVWLEISPRDRWTDSKVSVVTVWRNLLAPGTRGLFLLAVPANPISETGINVLHVRLTIDGTPSITSVSGVNMTISPDKSFASGTVTDVPPLQFKTLAVFFEAPDLLLYTVEEQKIAVDIETKRVTAELLLQNLGDAVISSLDFKLGKTASVLSVRSGIVNLGNSWNAEKGVLTVNFIQNLRKNDKVLLQIVYSSDEVIMRTGAGVEVTAPNLLNASVSSYYFSVITPPVSQFSYSGEPWQLRVVERNRREITYLFRDVFPSDREKVTISYAETVAFPVPLILLAGIALLGIFLGVRVAAPRKAVTIPALKDFQKSLEQVAEELLAEIEKYGPDEKPRKIVKNVEEFIKPIRTSAGDLRKELKSPEAVKAFSSLEHVFEELSITLHAFNRLVEDFSSNRIPKTVYAKLYHDYSRQVRKLLDRAMTVLSEASQ
ncbi:MAG: hypothetical protein QW463_04350 [Candidatus Caldarchaeum sp.]